LDARLLERRELTRRGDQRAGPPRLAHCCWVSAAQVDAADLVELRPGEGIARLSNELAADDGDRPFAVVIEVRKAAALRLIPVGALDPHAKRAKLSLGAVSELVVPEGGEEHDVPGDPEQRRRRDRAPTGRLCPGLPSLDDLAGSRHMGDARELDHLDVADYRVAHLTSAALVTLKSMMEAVTIPPFERFYEEHRDAVFRHLVRLLGRQRAEDAFQETFLRALRGYAKLDHGRHLKAWVFTIATRVAADEGRRRRPETELSAELVVDGERPAYAQLEHLAAALPEKERAAVVLRYGYDLGYDQIADALDSSEEAARQAASSGVRRLRRRLA
jgi:RNA polymerase sigma factor (sigma-70 family)